MVVKPIAIIIGLLIIAFESSAEIKLKRYSTSTYFNTNSVDQTAGDLGIKIANSPSVLSVLRVGFRQYSNPYINLSSNLQLVNQLTLLNDNQELVYGQILIYPNPFRIRDGATLQYVLNRPSNITIHLYDMFGHRVFSRVFVEGGEGARMGTNRLNLDANVFNYYDVPAGVYMLFIFDEANQLIGRSKFAIVP